jgi:hypothetical protein
MKDEDIDPGTAGALDDGHQATHAGEDQAPVHRRRRRTHAKGRSAFDDANKFTAPFQVKANGGVLIIDDFGRQQVRPRDLLNRWIVPLENRIDYLTLHTGRKVEVPFDVMVVFSTNLPPKDLVDEAFLRRLRHKSNHRSDMASLWRSSTQAAKRCVTSARLAYLAGVAHQTQSQPRRASARHLRSDQRHRHVSLRGTGDDERTTGNGGGRVFCGIVTAGRHTGLSLR